MAINCTAPYAQFVTKPDLMRFLFAILFTFPIWATAAVAENSFPERFTAALAHDEPDVNVTLEGCILRHYSKSPSDWWEQKNHIGDFNLDLESSEYSHTPAMDDLPATVDVYFNMHPKLYEAEAANVAAYSKTVLGILQNSQPPSIWRAILFPRYEFREISKANRELADQTLAGKFGPVLQRNYFQSDYDEGAIYNFEAYDFFNLTVFGPDAFDLLIDLQDWQSQHCPLN